MRQSVTSAAVIGLGLFVGTASAATIFATGQNNGDPSHSSGLFYYAIDTVTGKATPLASITGGNSAGLAGTPDGRLLGFRNNRVIEINPFTGATIDVSPVIPGFSTTSLDVTRDGSIYATPVSGDTRLHRIDPVAGTATPIGPAGSIGNSLDAFYGTPAGTTSPFIIGLGSITRNVNIGTNANPNFVLVDTLYGVHLDDADQLVAVTHTLGFASVVGALDSVGSSGNPGVGTFSGFAAMTGVDTDGDGLHDTIYGNVNFFDPDGPGAGSLPSQRLGGVARYDLTNGTWTMVGTNPGLIFFGFGSVIPEPATLSLLAGAGVLVLRRR
jgi:hypothetical protein